VEVHTVTNHVEGLVENMDVEGHRIYGITGDSLGLFAMKAVLSGKTSELIDLARTNLWR
jgi:hypothetical protein